MISSQLHRVLFTLGLILATAVGGLLQAQSPDSVEFFENRIRPVLVERCYECHSSDAGRDRRFAGCSIPVTR